MATRIFINYRRSDSGGEAGRLYDHLNARYGVATVFRDVDKIQPGISFIEALNQALDGSDIVLVVIGPEWLKAGDRRGGRRLDDPDDFVRMEVETALLREGLRTVPVLVGGATMPSAADLPESLQPLAELQALELRDGRFDDDVENLVRELGGSTKQRRRLGFTALAIIAVVALFFVLRGGGGPGVSNQNTEIVLDASKRMGEPFGDGTRLDAAEQALSKWVRHREKDNLALRAYGGACDANSNLALGFDTDQAADIVETAASLTAAGEANLANAVIEATGDFNDARRFPAHVGRRVVVFTAGLDTCVEDAARDIQDRLAELGVKVPVDFHFIGVGVPEDNREALQRVAKASGGRVLFADTVAQVEEATQLALEIEPESLTTPKPVTPSAIPGQREFSALSAVSAGVPMSFDWNGPNAPGDFIFVSALDLADNRYPLSSDHLHKTEDGLPATLVAPAKPGQYEIRYFSEANGTVLFRQALTVTDAEVRFRVPTGLAAGDEFEFSWEGPSAAGDLLFIAPPEMNDNRYYLDSDRTFKAASGSPASLIAPVLAGDYEIRYFSARNGDVLARQEISVAESRVRIEAPSTVSAGQEFSFRWQGPDAEGDFLFIAEAGMKANSYYSGSRRQHRTRDGVEGLLIAPVAPGTYEIRYFSKKNGETLAKQDLIVQ